MQGGDGNAEMIGDFPQCRRPCSFRLSSIDNCVTVFLLNITLFDIVILENNRVIY